MANWGRVACAAIILTLSAPGYAQTKPDATRATTLKKQGDELVHASKFREALQAYDESFAIVPNPAIQYNRGRALESLGEFPAALDALDQFVATAPADLKARVPNLDKTMADIATHVSTVVIHCAIAGAAVTFRGQSQGTTPIQPFRTAPGDATITATMPGYVVFTQDTTLAGGESMTIDVDLKKAAAQETATTHEPTPFDNQPPPPTPTPEQPSSGGHSGWRTLAWASGGIGLASLGAGMIFLGLALTDESNANPHCPNKVCDATGRQTINEAWTYSTASTVLVIVGSVGLATSLLSFIMTPKSSAVQARLFVTPGFASMGGSF